jgi:hypothetical protein
MEIGYKVEIGSVSCPMADFDVSGDEYLGCNSSGLYISLKYRMIEIK